MKKKKEMGQEWYFTFGQGQPNEGRFIKFFGTHEEARKEMFESFGDKWAFQYSREDWFNEDRVSQEVEYGLREMR